MTKPITDCALAGLPMSAELNELAERIEALGGPEREVDCLIYEADELRKSGIRLNLTPEMRGMYYGEPTGRYFDISGPEPVELPYKAPHYTASQDSAMALVPDDLPELTLNLSADAAQALIFRDGDGVVGRGDAAGGNPIDRAARAITAAALRSKAASQ